LVAVEEVVIPIKDSRNIKERWQGENFGGSTAKGGKEEKMQKGTIIIIATKENADLFGEDNGIHTKNHGDYVGGEFSKFNKDDRVTCVLQQLLLAPQQRNKTQTMWPLATHSLPMVWRRRGRPSRFADMRVKWKQKKTLRMLSKYKLVKANVPLKSNTMLI